MNKCDAVYTTPTGKRMDERMEGRKDAQKDAQKDARTNGCMDGQTEAVKNRPMHLQIHAQMENLSTYTWRGVHNTGTDKVAM